MTQPTFSKEYFRRFDESDDSQFYSFPRLVVHIDQPAIDALSELFGRLLPKNGTYLDLMSSWRTHLPQELEPQRVVGLGMNDKEMAENPQLDAHHVHNLNEHPILPFEDATFDGAMCTVSVQYLVEPFKVFAEVNRVLTSGAPFIVSFSNRCFPQKATAVWLNTADAQHVQLVQHYFEQGGDWTDLNTWHKVDRRNDPLYVVWGYKK